MGDIVKQLGHHGHWGFSSSFDCLEALQGSGVCDFGKETEESANNDPINILLLHAGDVRHVLSTITRRNRSAAQRRRPVHFYMLDAQMELIGRNLVLLEILNDYEVPIRQRANIFLEVFGNAHVQVRTGRYLEQLGHELRQLVVANRGRLENLVDLSLLRYKERDQLEDVFKSYSRKTIFDMAHLREHRLRGVYAERYDSRKAVSDWDYHQTLKPQASIIHSRLFKEWRMSGVAFEFGDQEYTEPNRTMMTFAEGTMKRGKARGELKEVKGFWGDVVVGPYLSFGVDCETPGELEEGLFEILNKDTGVEQHRHHAAEVAVMNMLACLWETETGTQYRMSRKNDIYSGLGSEAKALVPHVDPEELVEAITAGANKMEGEEIVPDKLPDDDTQLPPPPPTSEEEKTTFTSSGGHVVETGAAFSSVDEWKGCIPGYAFKLGDEGVGYYLDSNAESLVTQQVAVTTTPLAPSPSTDTADNKMAPNRPKEVRGGDKPQTTREDVPVNMDAEEMLKVLKRAECILNTYKGIKLYPLSGNADQVLSKPRYKGKFDMAYVSSRAVHAIEQPYFRHVLKARALVVAESAKFLCPLNKDTRAGYADKVKDYATSSGLDSIPAPVPMRYRDERDKIPDKFFFVRSGK